jgi:hypothetical protein
MILHSGCIDLDVQNEIISTIVNENFPWYWNEHQIDLNISAEKQISSFTHCFFRNEKVNSNYFGVLDFFIKELNNKKFKFKKLVRSHASFLCNINTNEEQDKNSIHIDDENEDCFTLIYYIFDSDGDTLLYDNNYNVIHKESPVQGNYIIFKSNTLHKGNIPKMHKKRMVINIIFKGEIIN